MKICPVCRYCFEDEETACARGHGILVPSRHGTRLIADKYRLERLLGRGGMGAVYAAVHVELDRPTAIKLLLPDFLWDAQALERFRREARAAARLNHPNIVDTYDYGVLPTGEAYIVMELVEGQTLREFMDVAHAMPVGEAAHLARQIAEGIDVAHHGGIVHRDLKPSNIILARDHRGRVLVKVVDFGIAKLKELSTSGGIGAVTNTGAVVGTPRYMSPEQCAGAEVDARSDIYSLAVILFEMLAGRPPFDAPSATALALKQVQEPPPPLETLRPDLPAELTEVVMHALAKDPARRPQTAGELARTLAAVERASRPDEDGEQTRDLSNARPPGLLRDAPSPQTSADALQETGAPLSPKDTGLPPAAPASTERAGTPTGEVATGEVSTGPTPRAQDGVGGGAAEAGRADAGAHDDGGAPAAPPDIDAPAAPTADEGAGTRAHEEVDEAAAVRLPDELTVPAASAPRAVGEGAPLPSPHEPVAASEAPRSRRGWALALIVITLGLAAALGTILALRGEGDTSDLGADAASRPRTENPPAAAQSPPPATPPPAPPANSSAEAAPDEVSEAELVDAPESQRRAIVGALGQWVEATNARDVDGQLRHYAPRLTSFYLARGVTRDAVRTEKQRTFGEAAAVQISIADPVVRLARDGRTAVVRFRKQFRINAGGQTRSGEVLQELHWARSGSGWKITSERDLQVIR